MPIRLIIFLLLHFVPRIIQAQFVPLPVTGFNQDVIAEGGPSSFATTTAALDAAGSNKVMYSSAFAGFAGIAAGLPGNGLITFGPDSYSLGNGNLASNNALFIFQGQTKSLSLLGTGTYSKLRMVCFSTEGPSTINVNVDFTDGTNTNYISNYVLPDWFFGTTNIIAQGFGRISRTTTGPWTADGLPSNPKLYYVEIVLNCADKQKIISGINITNISTSGNAPFPNTVIMGVSAISSAVQVTSSILPADCAGSNGSISLVVSGGGTPYSYTWNTIPVQIGPTATGLNPGTYTCVISDALGCTSTVYSGTVPLNNNSTMIASATPSTICAGGTAQLNSIIVTGALASFTWNPGNLSGTSITVTPSNTTTYTVSGSNSIGCNATAQVTVTVNPLPAASVANNLVICAGGTATLQVLNPQVGYTYNWYSISTGGTILSSGTIYTINNVVAAATYYLESINSNGCLSTTRSPVAISILQSLATPVVRVASVTGTSLSFSWNAIPGATGYEISTNGGTSFQSPSSGSNGTIHTLNGLAGNTTITIIVRALGMQSCETSAGSLAISGTTLSTKEIFVPNVFTPNGDGKNDMLMVYGNNTKSIEFRIFNQWGQLVFLSQDISQGWTGTFYGVQQPVGVYAYTLKVLLVDGTVVNKKGSINLIR